jgi:phosphotransferase system enzyme I (PtsI)
MILRPETTLKGIAASPGIAIGPVYIHQEVTYEPELRIIPDKDVENEIQLFRSAIKSSLNYLKKIYRESDKKYGKEFADIVQVQISILEDRFFLEEVESMIRQKNYNAAYATFVVFRHKKEHFLELSDEYFRERAFDIQNLKRLIIKKLLGKKTNFNFKRESIVVSDNVNPADLIKMHHKKTLGFCTNAGGKNSHTAIVARSLGVPAVVGTEYITNLVKKGDNLILDGGEGIIIINPGSETIQEYLNKQQKVISLEQNLLVDADKPAFTKDKKRIYVMGNVEFVEELEQLAKSGAEGIGLYRTEGLFLSGTSLPTEEIQTENYLSFAEAAYPNQVIIRTLDVGGDKLLPELVSLPEKNPFLGWRAIRFCLDHKKIFIPQIKAILRANQKKNIKLLLPMISSIEEIHQFKRILNEAIDNLEAEGKAFNKDIPIGMMVEIPSAAILIEQFLDEVDFFSIGTNDLIQYTLAVDRANEKISHLYSHFHPALLHLIKTVVDQCQKKGKEVTMCGEMAADPVAIPLLIGMGLEKISAAHFIIPEIKKVIRLLNTTDCKKLFAKVRELKTAIECQKICENYYANMFSVPIKRVNHQPKINKE